MSDIEQQIQKNSPSTETPLQQIFGNYYWSPYEKINYYDNNGKMVPLVSPLTGGPLEITEDGKLFSPYEKEYFSINDGKIVSAEVISPRTGGKMKKISDNLYFDPYEKITYFDSKGKLIPLISPLTGGPLEITEDGKLFSPYEKGYFTINESKGKIMPLFLPDDTMEPAYYEDECIVGIETNRKYPINEFGAIEIPFLPVIKGEEWNSRIERIRNMSQEEIDFNLDMRSNHPEYFNKSYDNIEVNEEHFKR